MDFLWFNHRAIIKYSVKMIMGKEKGNGKKNAISISFPISTNSNKAIERLDLFQYLVNIITLITRTIGIVMYLYISPSNIDTDIPLIKLMPYMINIPIIIFFLGTRGAVIVGLFVVI